LPNLAFGLKLVASWISRTYRMEQTLPENHPDLIRIVRAAHHDVASKPASNPHNSLANALSSALGNAPGSGVDLENIEFLIHVLSVNRAAGEIDDEAFERLLQRIKTKEGRAVLTSQFTEELEVEHGYEDEESD